MKIHAVAHRASPAPFSAKSIILTILSAMLLIAPQVIAQTAHFSGVETTVGNGLNFPGGVAVDASGSVYIADTNNNRVVKETLLGGVYNQVVVAAGLNAPEAVAVDGSNNVYICDTGNNQILKETLSAGAYTQTTVVTGISGPYSLAADASGNVFFPQTTNHLILEETPSAGGYVQSTVASGPPLTPLGVAVDNKGSVWTTSYYGRLFVETPVAGIYHQYPVPASGLMTPPALAVDASGKVYIANYSTDYADSQILVETPSAGSYTQSTLVSGLYLPQSVAVDGSGAVYIAVTKQSQVIKLQTGAPNFGKVPVGSSATKTLAFTIDSGSALAVPPAVLTKGAVGLDFTDAGTGTCTTNGPAHVYQSPDTCTVDVVFNPKFAGERDGAVELLDASQKVIATAYIHGIGLAPQVAYSPGLQTSVGSNADYPLAVALDSSGNAFLASYAGGRSTIVKLPINGGSETTVASGFSSIVALAVDGAGDVFAADFFGNQVVKIPADGSARTTVGSSFAAPDGVAVDGAGNVFFSNSSINYVLEVPADGSVEHTVGGNFSMPAGLAVDGAGNLFVADVGNQRVVEVFADGSGQIQVGGRFLKTKAVAVDAAGDVFVADAGYSRVVEVPADGSAQFTVGTSYYQPSGVAVDGLGNVFVTDPGLGHLVEVDRSTPPTLSSFQPTPIGTTGGVTSQAIVQNIGNQPLVAIAPGLTIGSNFVQVFGIGGFQDCTGNLALGQGGLCALTIAFAPKTVGPILSVAVLTDTAFNQAPATQTISLVGTGTPPLPTIHLELAPSYGYGETFQIFATSNSPGAITYSLISGPATVTLSGFVTVTGVGPVTILANQGAGGSYGSGSAAANFSAVTAGTVSILTVTPVKSGYGTAAILTSTVHSQYGAAPVGIASFYDGANLLAKVPLTNGVASFTTGPLTPGLHTFTASFTNGFPDFDDSVASDVTLNVASTQVIFTVTKPNLIYPEKIAFKVALAVSGNHNPTGTLAIYDGAALVQSFSVSAASQGKISGVLASPLVVGVHTLTGIYSGDPNYQPGKSNPVTVTVTPGLGGAGQIVGVQFVGGGQAPLHLPWSDYNAGAGLFSVGHWNPVLETGNTTNPQNLTVTNGLTDSTGKSSSLGFHLVASGAYYTGAGSGFTATPPYPGYPNQYSGPGDAFLFAGFAYAGYSDPNPLTLDVTGLDPAHKYDLLVYISPFEYFGNNQVASVALTGGATYYLTTAGNASSYEKATTTKSTVTPAKANYVQFDNLTGSSSQTVSLKNTYSFPLVPNLPPHIVGVNGFQIVDLGPR